jgi:hypothetical protein
VRLRLRFLDTSQKDYSGCYNSEKHSIEVSQDLYLHWKLHTVFHELLHFVFHFIPRKRYRYQLNRLLDKWNAVFREHFNNDPFSSFVLAFELRYPVSIPAEVDD